MSLNKNEEINRSKEEIWSFEKPRWHNGDGPSGKRWRRQHCFWVQCLQKVVKQYVFRSITVNLTEIIMFDIYTSYSIYIPWLTCLFQQMSLWGYLLLAERKMWWRQSDYFHWNGCWRWQFQQGLRQYGGTPFSKNKVECLGLLRTKTFCVTK